MKHDNLHDDPFALDNVDCIDGLKWKWKRVFRINCNLYINIFYIYYIFSTYYFITSACSFMSVC